MKEKKRKGNYVGIELPDEAGEVIVIEVFGEKNLCELWWIPYDETVAVSTPRDDWIGGGIVNHVIGLAEERRSHIST